MRGGGPGPPAAAEACEGRGRPSETEVRGEAEVREDAPRAVVARGAREGNGDLVEAPPGVLSPVRTPAAEKARLRAVGGVVGGTRSPLDEGSGSSPPAAG